jgi:tetratricopeptide (TPR) repeat protein
MATRPGNASLLLVFSFLASCASVPVVQEGSIEDYSRRIAVLSAGIVDNPRDTEALRELGVIYFQTQRYADAKEYLKKAYDLNGKDGETLFYYGMTLESLDEVQAALGVYLNYTDLSALSSYKRVLEGRYRALTRQIIESQLRDRLAEEQQLGDKDMSEATIAVFPLEYQGKDQKYRAIGLGVSELILTDLGKVQKLKAVERLRIDALISELQFSQSDRVDRSTAPRLGKLLTAGRLVSGAYNVSGNNTLRIDISLLNAVRKKYPDPASKSDDLDNLFKLEKDLVFALLKDMGITLSRAEREDIQRVPTKNLQAFILYCLGLEKEVLRDFTAATVFFNQAVELDPQFDQAKSKAEASGALSVASTRTNALTAAHGIRPPIGKDDLSLINNRLQNLGNTLGAPFFPGQEHRESVEEAARAGAAVRDLPKPPPPPQR